MIEYRTGNQLALSAVLDLFDASTLGERRPMDDPLRMGKMVENSNLVLTAWDGDTLVGLARSLTDWVYATYLADLAVRLTYQRQGIGKELMRRTQAAAPDAMLILLAAPKAVDYYPQAGLTQHPSAWVLKPGESIHSYTHKLQS